jgi:membrane fusion protein
MCFEIVSARFQDRGMNAAHNENLFRKQALRSLSEKKPGPPICLTPRPWAWLSGLTTLLFVSTAVFVGTAEYSRKESVRGWLVSKQGVVQITNRASAVVRRVVHQPGDQVKEGEALIYLSADSILSDGSSQSEEVLAQLRQELSEIDRQQELSEQQQQLEESSVRQQLEDFDREVAALASRHDRQRQRIDLTREKLRRLQEGADDGAVTRWDVIKQQEELGILEQGSTRLEQDTASQQRERERLIGHQESLPVRAEILRSTLRTRRMQLAQQIAEHESKRRSVLESPVTGTVASVEVHAGYSISAQRLLMTVLPENAELVAEVFVPSRAAGFIQPGQNVRIAYDAFPQQKFGTFEGRIAHISEFVLLPGEIPQTFFLREATYKVQIVVDDSPIQTSVGAARLRPGMLLAADIVLEKRNLIDWLLEPLRVRRNTAG